MDPHARHFIWEWLRALLAQGKTILLATHFVEEAERLCNRPACLRTDVRPHSLIDEQIGCDVIEIYVAHPVS